MPKGKVKHVYFKPRVSSGFNAGSKAQAKASGFVDNKLGRPGSAIPEEDSDTPGSEGSQGFPDKI